MKLLLLSALIAVALSQPMGSFDDEYQWGLFKVEHMKEYESEVEDQKRREIFTSNLKLVREHNAKYEQGEVTFDLEINKFADMTNKEFLETMIGFINPKEHIETGEDFVLDDSSDLQKTIDWRKKGAVTDVKNQLHCGSCWAFRADSLTCRYSPENKGATARSYVKVTSGEDSLQKAVSSIGPISVSMNASGGQFQLYKGGIYTDSDCSSEYTNHAVLAVGYGATTNGEDSWLVKNSWGTDWGMDGYIMIARNSNNMCGIASYGRYPKV